MQLGLHVPIFAWEGGSDALGQHLANVARAADEAGFAQITVMDHFFALGPDDAYRNPMLEAYTALGFIAACTSRIRVGSQVTGVTYRHPGVLIKQATTLNVLSQGPRLSGHRRRVVRKGAPRLRRAVPAAQGALRATRRDAPDRPPGVERRRQSVSGQVLPARRAAAVANGREQAAAEDPHRRQRRAQDAEAGGAVRRRVPRQRPVLDGYRHKLEVLDEHCAKLGRDPKEIERTAGLRMNVEQDGSNVDDVVRAVSEIGEVGFDMVTMALPDVYNLRAIELFGDTRDPTSGLDWTSSASRHQRLVKEAAHVSNIVVTGSVAFDHIMDFPGRFKEHILPDKVHMLSVSFLVDNLKKVRGGCAANIAYNLALLGETTQNGRHRRRRLRRVSSVARRAAASTRRVPA